MNWVDLAIVTVVLLSALVSLFRGFVREVLSLLAWVVAFWAALTFARSGAVFLEPYTTVEAARIAIAFVVILVGTLVLAGVVNYLVGRLVAGIGLSGVDRLLGVLFGVLRGGAIVAIVVFGAGLTALPAAPWWQSAQLLPPFENAALFAAGFLPADFARHVSY